MLGSFALHLNAPNPFNSETAVHFSLPRDGEAKLTVYNLLRLEVAVLAAGPQAVGEHAVRWDGRDQRGVFLSLGNVGCVGAVGGAYAEDDVVAVAEVGSKLVQRLPPFLVRHTLPDDESLADIRSRHFYVLFFRRGQQPHNWGLPLVQRQDERAPMAGQHDLAAQIYIGLYALLRHHVDGFPALVVLSALDEGEVGGAVLVADLLKVRSISAVAAKTLVGVLSLQYPGCPLRLISVA